MSDDEMMELKKGKSSANITSMIGPDVVGMALTIARLQHENERLSTDNARLRKLLDEAYERTKMIVDDHSRKIEELELENKRLRDENKQLRLEVDKVMDDNQSLSSRLAAVEAENKSQDAKIQSQDAKIQSQDAKIDHLMGDRRELLLRQLGYAVRERVATYVTGQDLINGKPLYKKRSPRMVTLSELRTLALAAGGDFVVRWNEVEQMITRGGVFVNATGADIVDLDDFVYEKLLTYGTSHPTGLDDGENGPVTSVTQFEHEVIAPLVHKKSITHDIGQSSRYLFAMCEWVGQRTHVTNVLSTTR